MKREIALTILGVCLGVIACVALFTGHDSIVAGSCIAGIGTIGAYLGARGKAT